MHCISLFVAFVTFCLFSLGDVAQARPNRIRSRAHQGSNITPSSTTAAAPVTLHQYHMPRAVLDVCVFIDVQGLHILGVIVDLNICLCLSALSVALESNVQLAALVNLFGKDAVLAELTALINSLSGAQQCSYPEHSHPVCSEGNPCGFTCDPPLVPQGQQCVCNAPYMSCNGQCGSFPNGCGSAVPHA
ncbi:hypothetical protein C8Q75DRAFT_803815 [Abortiporus biennis]|nr:hypothetical protein C8Q75DRAFT_803815 [Abortiporus biennis]